MSFEIKDDEMLWHHNGKTTVVFREMSLDFPVLCGFRATTMEDVSNMIFKKDFSCKAEFWFKRQIVLAMFQDNPEDKETCAYIRKKFTDIFSWCIDENKINTAKALINSGKFITKRNVQKWIQYTIDNHAHEVYLLLTEYKNKNLGYQDISKKLKL